MKSPSLKDRFIPKIQSDEEKIRKVNTKIETKNLASTPSGVDLLSFRQEMGQAWQGEQQIQKTVWSYIDSLNRCNSRRSSQNRINTRALGNTP